MGVPGGWWVRVVMGVASSLLAVVVGMTIQEFGGRMVGGGAGKVVGGGAGRVVGAGAGAGRVVGGGAGRVVGGGAGRVVGGGAGRVVGGGAGRVSGVLGRLLAGVVLVSGGRVEETLVNSTPKTITLFSTSGSPYAHLLPSLERAIRSMTSQDSN